jgi:hypothetical protein
MSQGFEAWQVAQRAVAIMFHPENDFFNMLFCDFTTMNICQRTARVKVVCDRDFLQILKNLATRREVDNCFAGGGFGVCEMGFFGVANKIDGLDEQLGDAALVGIIGKIHRLMSDLECIIPDFTHQFIAVSQPEKERISVQQKPTFEAGSDAAEGKFASRLLKFTPHEASPIFAHFAETFEGGGCFGERGIYRDILIASGVNEGFDGGGWRLIQDLSAGRNHGENGVVVAKKSAFPGRDAHTLGAQSGGGFGVFFDVLLSLGEVAPGRVVGVNGGTKNGFVTFLAKNLAGVLGRFEVLPVENHGLGGHHREGVGVLVEHIAPHAGGSSVVDDALGEGGKMLAIELRFGVGSAFAFELLNAERGATKAELGGFVSADMDKIRAKNLYRIVDELFAKIEEDGVGGVGRHALKRFAGHVAARLGVQKSLEMAEQIDEGNDLESGEFALDAGDDFGGKGVFARDPGSGRVGEPVFEVKPHRVVAAVEGQPAELGKVLLGRALLPSHVIKPHLQVHGD